MFDAISEKIGSNILTRISKMILDDLQCFPFRKSAHFQ